jgi:hypothetical protein
MLDININPFKELVNGFAWCLTLGQADTEHIKGEIEDLLMHCSQSLKSLLELTDTLKEIPLAQFTEQNFWPVANHCFWFFTSPGAAQKARTHCTDIQRDVGRITFRMAKILRTEDANWKGIDVAFRNLLHGDMDFLECYEGELQRIGDEVTEIGKLLTNKDVDKAWEKYNLLRSSLLSSRQALSQEIAMMQKAQTHIHALLT